jgi:UDPglucose 6-dehydrogenase
MKISIIGVDHMAQSFSYCMERIGHKITSIEECDVCWIAIDTPIGKDGKGDINPVFEAVQKIKPQIKAGTRWEDVLVLCSSQVPVGTSREFMKILGNINYAYIPEHMRIGRGIFDFMNAPLITAGIANEECKHTLKEMFYDKEVFFTNIETAEMIKHATNAYLATTVSFINDIADICDKVGADVADVTTALRADWRIGKEAYLDVSVGFRGGHLDRELNYLHEVAEKHNIETPVLDADLEKNHKRRDKIVSKLINL